MKHKFLFIQIIILTSYIFAENKSIDKIVNYAQNNTSPTPTCKDYADANISGITPQNLNKVNQKIVKIQSGKRDPAYRYPPNKDYIYNFQNSNVKEITLRLKDSIIDLKKHTIDTNTSVFLKISVNTTKLGQYFTPKISTIYKGNTYQHTLEPGAKGLRYLNLSNLQLTDNTKIKLEGNLVSLEEQNVVLLIFKNPEIKNKKILVIAPHPDDAEIAAYGLYSQYPDNVHIVTITSGEAGSNFKYKEVFKTTKEQYLAKGKKRTIDSITVPLLGDVAPEQCVNLGYFDGKLNAMHLNKLKEIQGSYIETANIKTFRKYNISTLAKDLNGSSTWISLVDNLAYLLDRLKPDIIVTPHSSLDRHRDHQLSSTALFSALKKSNIQKGKLFLYTNHAIGSEYYPYGNVGESMTLPLEHSGFVYFNGIYSHQLSQNTQNKKVFTLEAMSDLRFTPQGSIFQSPCNDKLHLLCKDYSYVRRSVRSNELFFIVDIENIYDDTILNKLL